MRHLWYISNVSIGFSFFDERLDIETKVQMVESLNKTGKSKNEYKYETLNESSSLNIIDFISAKTSKLFEILSGEENHQFLLEHPSKWINDPLYVVMQKIVKNLIVVNDPAERAIGLIKDLNNTITADQKNQNHVIQVIEDFRKKIPDLRKSTLIKSLTNK